MKVTVKKEITLASRRKQLHKSTLGTVFARFEGKAAFTVETDDPAKVELTISKEAELKINDLFLGASGSVKVSGDKLEFGIGTDQFAITFNPFSLNPLSFHLPAVKLPIAGQSFKLEQELPALGLTGTAEIEVEFVIDFIPDYARLAKAANAKTIKAALQTAKNSLYQVASKAKTALRAVGGHMRTMARLTVNAGRAAVYAPLKLIGNSIGRNLAWNALWLNSQRAALGKLLGYAGKFLGAVTIIVQARMLAKAAVPGLLARRHKEIIQATHPVFARAYAEFLLLMTDPSEPLMKDGYFTWTSIIQRFESEPPDLYGVIEHLSATNKVQTPDKNASDWTKEQIRKGIPLRRELIVLAETDPHALYREAYNAFTMFLEIAHHSSSAHRRAEATKAIDCASKLLVTAAQIAAYRDIYAFVLVTSLYEDMTGAQATDVWSEWRNVAAFHRAAFGADLSMREVAYLGMMDVDSLKISIPPFGDYD